MKKKIVGRSDISASLVGLGTFEIGGSTWWDIQDDDRSIKTIRTAIDMGVNFIDTAPVYGFGRSENIVGRAIKGLRDGVVISTKFGEVFNQRREGRYHYSHDGRDVFTHLSRKSILEQLEQSLRNLDTDYVDVFCMHFYFADEAVGVPDEIVRVVEDIIASGKARSFSASNLEPKQVEYFSEMLGPKLSSYQIYSNVLDREDLNASFRSLALEREFSLFSINSLAKGILTGSFPDNFVVKEGSERSESAWFSGGHVGSVNEMLRAWQPLCDKYEANPAALAIAWALSQPATSHAIVGASHPEHISSMITASEIPLGESDAMFMTSLAANLREALLEGPIKVARAKIVELVESRLPIIIWGAGVTLDYLCRQMPISKCNIIHVIDSNERLLGEQRFGAQVIPTSDLPMLRDDALVLTAIPIDHKQLNEILRGLGNTRSTLHLGHLKSLCK